MKELNRHIGRALIGVELVAIMAYYIALALRVNTIQQTLMLTVVSTLSIGVIIF